MVLLSVQHRLSAVGIVDKLVISLQAVKKIREEFSVKRISKKLITKVTALLEGEVKVYDQYVTGDVYGFKMFVDGKETDACWGFFGSDVKTNGVLDYVSDKIIVKYRTEKDSPTTATCTWADIDRITTTENVSSYEIGDEVEFIQGAGSGRFFTISSISENSGTYTVVFSESMPSPVIGIGAIARFTKWKLLGEVTSSDTRQYKQFSPNLKNISPMIQIKVGVLSTGDNEMYSLYLQSEQTIK